MPRAAPDLHPVAGVREAKPRLQTGKKLTPSAPTFTGWQGPRATPAPPVDAPTSAPPGSPRAENDSDSTPSPAPTCPHPDRTRASSTWAAASGPGGRRCRPLRPQPREHVLPQVEVGDQTESHRPDAATGRLGPRAAGIPGPPRATSPCSPGARPSFLSPASPRPPLSVLLRPGPGEPGAPPPPGLLRAEHAGLGRGKAAAAQSPGPEPSTCVLPAGQWKDLLFRGRGGVAKPMVSKLCCTLDVGARLTFLLLF